jgi:plasmid maintenance system antidote protein VapI
MEIKILALVEKIEKLRNILHALINNNTTLTDKTIVDCSQELDILLIEYEKCKNNIYPSDAA